MTSPSEPKLAPPGAGLPLPELLIGRMLFGLRRLTGNRDSFDARFRRERTAIRALLKNVDDISLPQRVLIQRPPGLEDSSRYWSVLMTLDHLRIVNLAFVGIVTALGSGKVPKGEVNTAAVKPDPAVTTAVLAEYEASCDALLVAVTALADLKTSVRFAHPWFGPMDAYGWHALAGGHMGIHRVQIERILAGMTGDHN